MSTNLVSVFATSVLLVFFGAGCADSRHVSSPPGSVAQAPLTRLAESRVELVGGDRLRPGDVTLSFTVRGEDGRLLGVDDLKVAHEKRLHLLLVCDDMTRFQHLHPEYVDGRWTVKTSMPDAGMYHMYVDIAPRREQPLVLRVPLIVGGETRDAKPPEPTADHSASDGQYAARLMIEQPLRTQETKQWTFIITKNNQPVTSVAPYLGAFGHVVELRHGNPDDFFHVHPVTEREPRDGRVIFEGLFPIKGRYTLYAQFNLDGAIKTFPITVDVNEDGEPSAVKRPGH